MRKSLWILILSVVVIGAGSASAKTPDGKPPSQETVCDNEKGAAYGLCNSYCEAKDCTDPNQRASNQGCESVRRNFEKKTGRPMPCLITCPCAGLLDLFAKITAGAVGVQRCTADDNLLVILTTTGDQAIIDSTGTTANCNVNGEGPFVTLTPAELLVCRVKLRQAVEATGVVCHRSE
jgi:hypothetical protein